MNFGCCGILFFACWLFGVGVGIILNKNQYEDLYVVIEDSVKEDPDLLTRIKEVFTEASSALFTATDNMVYFGKIKVVIPKSWSTSANYIMSPALATPESYVKIADGKRKVPHVKRRSDECGVHGEYMYLTPEFFLHIGRTEWGKHANVIVHEWGHLRWGLFEEYPTNDKFYMGGDSWKPVTCTDGVQGAIGLSDKCDNSSSKSFCNTAAIKRIMHPNCTCCPSPEQTTNSSIMSYTHVDKLNTFCDKDDPSVEKGKRHNSVAPTKQNLNCGSLSAWEVMRLHDDFKTGVNPLQASVNTAPEFELVQEGGDIYRVFVLDTSGSMNTNMGERIKVLHQTCEYIIQEVLPLGSWLGIVTFSGTAVPVKNVQQILSDTSRKELIQNLPTLAIGSTCIGCGLEEGLNMLKAAAMNQQKIELILVSDGDNREGDLDKTRKVMRDSGVVIHTIAVTQDADSRLTDIAKETGGKHFTYFERGSISFTSAFSEAITKGLTLSFQASETLVSEKIDSVDDTSFSFKFTIDEGLGNDTSVIVLTQKTGNTTLVLRGPNNYTDKVDSSERRLTLKIPGKATVGEYEVVVNTSARQRIEYTVKSSPVNQDVIRITARLSKSVVDFQKGELPVIYADVQMSHAPVINATVTAIVETGSSTCEIELKDNGQDPDGSRNDGTYSGILFDCLINGRVNIKVKVKGDSGKTKVLTGVSGVYSPYKVKDSSEIINSSFNRVTTLEVLTIKNFEQTANKDIIPPGRITDMQIVNIKSKATAYGESRNYTLTWTAPGDDRNLGQAAAYQFRISSNYSELLTDFDNAEELAMLKDSIIPQISGTQEALELVVDAKESYTDRVFLAVRAVDEAGNVGKVSNIISVTVARGYRAASIPVLIEEGLDIFTMDAAYWENDADLNKAVTDDYDSVKEVELNNTIYSNVTKYAEGNYNTTTDTKSVATLPVFIDKGLDIFTTDTIDLNVTKYAEGIYNTTSDTKSTYKDRDLSKEVTIGLGVGGVAFTLAVIVLLLCVMKIRNKRRRHKPRPSVSEDQELGYRTTSQPSE